jgi:glycosyltransferase involved in cell wall biosynthesis
MSGAPEISIVIPTNGGRFLGHALASVQAQTVAEWELVIVDDGSTDGTAGVAANLAASDGRVRVVRQSSAGIAGARNRGLVEISPASTYVALLDHDDVWMPDALAVLREALAARPEAAAAHGLATVIDADGAPRWRDASGAGASFAVRRGIVDGCVEVWPPERPTEFANLAFADCITSVGSVLIRHAALARTGGFDQSAEPADDYDLWIRLSRRGEIAFVNRVVLGYRQHQEARSNRPPPPRGRGAGYVRHKLVTSPENTPAQRRLAIAGFRAHARAPLAQRWSDLATSWRRHEYRTLPRQSAAALLRLLAYVRGRPWRWQR